jgi:rare lipoprotein A
MASVRPRLMMASLPTPSLADAGRVDSSAFRQASGVMIRASYYDSGARTASGEPFRAGALTAAHRTLPFGTRLRLTNPRTGRSVTVRINDRGPFVRGRSLDVSRGAAAALGMLGSGTATLRMARM